MIDHTWREKAYQIQTTQKAHPCATCGKLTRSHVIGNKVYCHKCFQDCPEMDTEGKE